MRVKRKTGQLKLGAFASEVRVHSTRVIRSHAMMETLRGVSEYLTVEQIAKRRGVSTRAIYKQLGWLRQYGYLDANNTLTSNAVNTLSGSLRSVHKMVRLHDLRLKVEILRFSPAFKSRRREYLELDHVPYQVKRLRNVELVRFALDRWRVEVTTKSFMLFPPDVVCGDAHEALLGLFLDAKRLVRKLEARFNVSCLEKGERLNIKVVGNHAALMENVMARWYNREKRVFEVYDEEGTLRLIIDNSLRLHEFEAVSPMFAVDDSGVVKEFFADLLKHPKKVGELAQEINEIRALLAAQVAVQKLQAEVGVRTSKQVKDLGEWMQ